ncbi:MAG: dockerin type I repeat-containing protein [Clostridia bacterium]|nr:dockerin type I repeat-containing protein [Clostridia bacterium]
MASWPSSASSSTPSFTTALSTTACKGGSWSHNWNSGTVTTAAASDHTGVMTYTCDTCGETETRTIPMTVQLAECDHSVEIETTPDEGFAVTFAGDSGVSSIIVYETQDYSGASETISADGTTVSRSSETGNPDSTGNGQVNFTVVPANGYTVADITVTGSYKNLKGPADTGKENTYRITKVSGALTVTVTTAEGEDEGCPVSFVTDDHASINLYYTQDYTAPDETNVTSAVSRSSDSGKPDSSGDGQLNFAVVVDDGYELDSVIINGTYKALKDVSTQEIANLFRITKVASELTVTVTTKEVSWQEVVFEAKAGSTAVFETVEGVNYIYGLNTGLTSDLFLADYIEYENAVITFSTQKIATGSVVTVTAADSGIKNGEYIIVIFGDVDGDGYYDAQDATFVSSLAAELITPEKIGAAAYMAADCNHDGAVDSSDAQLLIQAGVLLAEIDQSKTAEELSADSAYIEYISLIDQTVRTPDNDTAAETETDQISESNGVNAFITLVKQVFKTVMEKINVILSLFKFDNK